MKLRGHMRWILLTCAGLAVVIVVIVAIILISAEHNRRERAREWEQYKAECEREVKTAFETLVRCEQRILQPTLAGKQQDAMIDEYLAGIYLVDLYFDLTFEERSGLGLDAWEARLKRALARIEVSPEDAYYDYRIVGVHVEKHYSPVLLLIKDQNHAASLRDEWADRELVFLGNYAGGTRHWLLSADNWKNKYLTIRYSDWWEGESDDTADR